MSLPAGLPASGGAASSAVGGAASAASAASASAAVGAASAGAAGSAASSSVASAVTGAAGGAGGGCSSSLPSSGGGDSKSEDLDQYKRLTEEALQARYVEHPKYMKSVDSLRLIFAGMRKIEEFVAGGDNIRHAGEVGAALRMTLADLPQEVMCGVQGLAQDKKLLAANETLSHLKHILTCPLGRMYSAKICKDYCKETLFRLDHHHDVPPVVFEHPVCETKTRKLLKHWLECSHAACPICQPLGWFDPTGGTEGKGDFTYPLIHKEWIAKLVTIDKSVGMLNGERSGRSLAEYKMRLRAALQGPVVVSRPSAALRQKVTATMQSIFISMELMATSIEDPDRAAMQARELEATFALGSTDEYAKDFQAFVDKSWVTFRLAYIDRHAILAESLPMVQQMLQSMQAGMIPVQVSTNQADMVIRKIEQICIMIQANPINSMPLSLNPRMDLPQVLKAFKRVYAQFTAMQQVSWSAQIADL